MTAPKALAKENNSTETGKCQMTLVLRTLLVCGYKITDVKRISGDTGIVTVEKRDKLGALGRTAILFSDTPTPALLDMLKSIAENKGMYPLLVTNAEQSDIASMSPEKFFEVLGGQVHTGRLFRNDL